MSGELRLPTGPHEGPFLQAALLCEKVLLEPDGVATVIRIIDQITVQPLLVGSPSPEAAQLDSPGAEESAPAPSPPPSVLPVSLVVIFKSGNAPGNYLLAVVLQTPDGRERPLPSQEIELTAAPHGGAQHVHQLNLVVREPGDYRFDVSLNGQFVTSVPLRVDFAPSSLQT
jgi:hypothetical protein